MFLFKKSKNKTLRIGLNLMVYSFPICMLLYFIVHHLNAMYEITSSLLQLSFTSLGIGFIMAFVGFFFLSEKPQKQQKSNTAVSKRTIYWYNAPKSGTLHERVELSVENGIHYYTTMSGTDRFHCGGEKQPVPEIFIKNGKANEKLLLVYIAKRHSYMDSMEEYRQYEMDIEEALNTKLLREVVLCKKPLSSCGGNTEPTDFIISIFTTKVEIKWGVGWRGGSSHADGAGNTEILKADYFNTHTINDFVSWMESKGWGKDFVKWFDVANNPKITSLFTSACQAADSGYAKMKDDIKVSVLEYMNSNNFAKCNDKVLDEIVKAICDIKKFPSKLNGRNSYNLCWVEPHMGATIRYDLCYDDSVGWCVLSYIWHRNPSKKLTPIPDFDESKIDEWLVGFVVKCRLQRKEDKLVFKDSFILNWLMENQF